MKRGWFLGAAIAVAVAGVPAYGHVVLAVKEAPAGSYYKAVFQVPHGCDGAATIGLRVTLPEGVVIAKPEPKPGWQVRIEHEPLQEPVVNEGHRLTERVRSVGWEGGRLPDEEFDEFVVMTRLPADAGRVSFPVIQVCEGGKHVDWVEEAPSEPSQKPPPHPAPSVRLVRGAQ